MSGQKTIFWDFDSTLVQFTTWRVAIMNVLKEYEPDQYVDEEQIRPFLRDDFPWHKPEEPHLHLSQPEKWWANLELLFARAYRGVGFNAERAAVLAKQVRKHMVNPKRYILFDDTIPVLTDLKNNGWRHVILSNHIPELPYIVSSMELSPLIDLCITSAATGYEKPNPQAFKIALSLAGNPKTVWMVGDNPVSDVQGAEKQGIPAILVRNPPDAAVKYSAQNLWGAMRIIEGKW